MSFPPELVKEIIIGARTNEDDLKRAFELKASAFQNAAMKVAVLDIHSFSMRVEPAPPMQFMQLVRRSGS